MPFEENGDQVVADAFVGARDQHCQGFLHQKKYLKNNLLAFVTK